METNHVQQRKIVGNDTTSCLPLISVIIPVYNVEQYIEKCIKSVIAQTNSEWELILVDDGSKDTSGTICDRYARQDARIKVIHKENGGVSSARNAGLKIAKGDYVCFIDSDDWIDSTYLEDFKVKEYDADLYISGALYDVYGKVFSYKKYESCYNAAVKDISNEFIRQKLIENGYPWGKLFRTDIIRQYGMEFNQELTINEDHLFVLQFYANINSLFITSTAGYHYTVFDNSGRKLSNKRNTYTELLTASHQFSGILNVLYDKWRFSQFTYEKWMDGFVYGKRLLALRSLILNKEYKYLSVEIAYWERTAYIPVSKEQKLLLSVIKGKMPLFIKRLFLTIYYNIRLYLHRGKEKQVYKDLQSRSIICDKDEKQRANG